MLKRPIVYALLGTILLTLLVFTIPKARPDSAPAEEPAPVVGMGGDHTCAAWEEVLKCWGLNTYGQLGIGSTDQKFAPAEVAGIDAKSIVQITGGEGHTCALLSNNDLYCWGVDVVEPTQTPVKLEGLSVSSMDSGDHHICAITTDPSLVCWGHNSMGQLGQIRTEVEASMKPLVVDLPAAPLDVSVDELHSCAVLVDGSVWCWGSNSFGQLGNGATENSDTPVKVENLPIKPTLVAAGSTHTCVLSEESGAYCWGNNEFDQIGEKVGESMVIRPHKVAGSSPGVYIEAGQDHTCAIALKRNVECWGAYWEGQLGTGDMGNKFGKPVSPAGIDNPVVSLAVGRDHACASLAGGKLFCWGDDRGGQIGSGNRRSLESVVAPSGFSDVDLGAANTCAVALTQKLYCWGAYWKTATSSEPSLTPTVVEQIDSPVADIAMGLSHRCALGTDGRVWCWGSNGHGESSSSAKFVNVPELVDLPGPASILEAGLYHNCAVLLDGRMFCWGKNFNGQLAVGDTVEGPTPRLSSIRSPLALAMGEDHTCALLQDRSVQCAGRGDFDLLGNGSTEDSLTFAPVEGLPAPTRMLTAGRNHTCAALENGQIWCWGRNNYSQLGSASFSNKSLPVQVAGLTDVVDIDGGKDHTCAVKSDGSVWCWGTNWSGQMGVYNYQDNVIPKRVLVLTDQAVSVSAGGEFTCIITTLGGVTCWGNNIAGQLGNGTKSVFPGPLTVKPDTVEPSDTPTDAPAPGTGGA